MKAETIERLNQQIGAPPGLYLTGKTVKELFHRLRQPCIETTDHQPIMDNEVYSLSEIGVWTVE